MKIPRGQFGSFIAFIAIAALVAGGLGWVTREALRMEDARHESEHARELEKLCQQRTERVQELGRQNVADRGSRMRQALMLCDSRLTPALAREDSRPFSHFEALYTPFPAVNANGTAFEPGQVLIPSPLMTASLPDWMLLHFQVDPVKGWTSPQVIPESLQKILRKQPIELALDNVDDVHCQRLDELRTAYPPRTFLASLRSRGIDYETVNKQVQQSVLDLNINPANAFNQNTTGQNSIATPQQQAPSNITNNVGNDRGNSDDGGRRYQVLNRGKAEGLWSYFNDGRSYSLMQSSLAYKALADKQTELEGIEQKLTDTNSDQSLSELKKRGESLKKEVDELRRTIQPVEVELTSMQPVWLPSAEKPRHLLMLRPARVGNLPAYQGILLDWTRLQEILKTEIDYLLPDAGFVPLARNNPERLDHEMFALPIELVPGPLPEPESIEEVALPESPAPRWTPLRVGLALAWAAALIALMAVGLGGLSLLQLSERRIRFVSAVTHELRTPLTTLRLYLDLLNSGMVTEETQRDEYIKTLSGEADRLHRLIGNVLDFARLEKTRPTVDMQPVPVAGIVEQLRETWVERCAASGKDLETDCLLPADATVTTDRNLVEQILGNLIDNARKYSQDAADRRITLRAKRDGDRLIFEVEDCGPGVTQRERGSIFRAFRRGRDADTKAGGVGLGLALATRWAGFIGGRLSVCSGKGSVGACFRLELPAA